MFSREPQPDQPGQPSEFDVDELACPTCHRDLQPWEPECPDCREPAVLRHSLAPAMPPVPAHLREDPRTLAPSGSENPNDAEALIGQAFPRTEQETREPLDDDLPDPPPVGGDPHFD